MTDTLAKIPLNGFEVEEGGVGVNITFDWLQSELKKTLAMKPDEVFSQVNVTEQGLTFYFKNLTENSECS